MVIENPLLLYREKFFDVNDDLRTVQEWKATDFEVFYGSTVNMCTRRKQHTGTIANRAYHVRKYAIPTGSYCWLKLDLRNAVADPQKLVRLIWIPVQL